jgi:toxin ParE1/3/4
LRRTVRKSVRAELDLISIWEYSLEQWDATQADKYLDALAKGISALADNPELGVSRDVLRAGYRALFINSHAVYYTFTPGAIFIVRVLHEGMDPGRHF